VWWSTGAAAWSAGRSSAATDWLIGLGVSTLAAMGALALWSAVTGR